MKIFYTTSLLNLLILLFYTPYDLNFSQTFKVEGKVTAADTIPVKYADVNFTFVNDTTQKFSTLTDSSGNYNLDITVTSLDDDNPVTPTSFELAQNYPNPFLIETAILYKLNEHSNLSLVIYDILGQEVRRLNIGEKSAGVHGITWDGRNNFNQKVAPGIYIYQLQNGKEKITKKMVYGMGESKIPEIHLSFQNNLVKNNNVQREDLVFTVEIKDSDSTQPKIFNQIFENITIKNDTTLNFIVDEAELKTVNINGKVLARSTPVKNAEVRFINTFDTSKNFSAVTDTLGSYSLSVKAFSDELMFNVEVNNIETTLPQIFDLQFDGLIIQNDTIINLYVDVVSPWIKVRPGITSAFNDIQFTDSLNGWVVGYNGVILRSYDSGESWYQQSCPINEVLCGVDFVDTLNGWICSWYSILKTVDGGKNWELKYNTELGDGSFYEVKFLTDKIGFVVGSEGFLGSNGILLRTSDGGETWQNISSQNWGGLRSISIVDEQNIWICGTGRTILFSSDTGLTWTMKSFSYPESWFSTIQFIDKNHGFLGCDDNDPWSFFRTTDGSNTWIQGPHELYLGLGVKTLFFVDSLNGWLAPVLGASGWAIINTTDGGQTWGFLPLGTNLNSVTSFSFINKNLGWAVGIEAIDTKPKSVILLYKKHNSQ